MKFFLSLLMVTCFFSVSHTQEEVEVFQKEEGNTVFLVGKNNLDEGVELTLKVVYKGYKTEDNYPKTITLQAKEEKTLTTLTVPPNTACELGTSVSYKKINQSNKRVTKTTGVQINPTKVNVFTKEDCARCAFVLDQFEKNKVVFLELNTSIAPSNNDLMFEKLKEAGYKENKIQMPVVIYNGEVFYNIKDLQAFVKKFTK